MGIFIIRTFVQMRETLVTNQAILKRLSGSKDPNDDG